MFLNTASDFLIGYWTPSILTVLPGITQYKWLGLLIYFVSVFILYTLFHCLLSPTIYVQGLANQKIELSNVKLFIVCIAVVKPCTCSSHCQVLRNI